MGRIYFSGITAFLLFVSSNLFAVTFVVTPNNNIKSLTRAIDTAKDGDTILIKPGLYKEGAIFLKKSLVLLGENFPEIDGENKYENLTVEHENVVIKGILFKNSGSSSFNDIASLKINNTKNILIENCRFENNFFAILTMNSSYVSYLNNVLESGKSKDKPAANGIHSWKCNHLTIKNNKIHGHRDGIYFEFVTHSFIQHNESIGNSRYGMHFMFSHDNVFRENVYKGNGAGVAVMYSKRVEMYNNVFADNWGGAAYGLLLKEINDSKIDDNDFTTNTMAIFADGSNRIEIKNNRFTNNGWALKINASSSDFIVTNNNFIGNTFDLATNGKLIMKSLDGNFWDKYDGYDLNKDGVGDVPYRPITFYSLIIERNPGALMLFRSFFVSMMDKAESVLPSMLPENLKDNNPSMKKIKTIHE
ncbi:MAG: nitrous oxide reductase family maturation protein NosD [Bacteroidia bacterium]|nr:nitrous oxide reductase family maturation protein NosD [Bacteroidia bacterium]